MYSLLHACHGARNGISQSRSNLTPSLPRTRHEFVDSYAWLPEVHGEFIVSGNVIPFG